MKEQGILSLVLLLFYLHICSANNNFNPCFNQSASVVVPFREVSLITAYLYIPFNETVVMHDATGCYTLQMDPRFQTEILQSESNWAGVVSDPKFRGTLKNICTNEPSYFLFGQAVSFTTLYITIAGDTLSPVTISALNLIGSLSSLDDEIPANITLGGSVFTSNTTRFALNKHRDEYQVYSNSQCSFHVREDTREQTWLISSTIPIQVSISDGRLLNFTFPAGVRTRLLYTTKKRYFKDCTCGESTVF